MCPGGLIVPASTAPGEIVVNGMSLSRRDSPYANSGLVTSVDEIDFQEFSHHNALSGMYYQAHIEKTQCLFFEWILTDIDTSRLTCFLNQI